MVTVQVLVYVMIVALSIHRAVNAGLKGSFIVTILGLAGIAWVIGNPSPWSHGLGAIVVMGAMFIDVITQDKRLARVKK